MEVDLTKSWPWRVAMIEFFITTLRLARSVGSDYRRDPQFRSLVFLVLVTLLGGTVFYSTMEGWSVVDALYFSVTTLTTVGLGDLAPKTTIGKIFIFAGLRIIVGFIETVAKETLDRQIGRGGGEEGQEEEGVSGT
jgi:hypothetical protein